MVKLVIDNLPIEVEEGTTVLEAAQELGIDIPTLCYLKEVNVIASCRICLVELEGHRNLVAACALPAAEGMVIRTHTPHVLYERKKVLELLLSDHPFDCLTCFRNLNCELQTLAQEFNIHGLQWEGERNVFAVDDLSPSLVREPSKCIRCRRCVTVCRDVLTVSIYDMQGRGFDSVQGPAFNDSIQDTPCTTCGQCILVCPTAALHEKDDTDKVWTALQNPDMHVVIQTAPSIRVSLGEEFGMPQGELVEGKMITALNRLGFDKVFDDCFGADVCIMEESTELLTRLEGNGGPLPQFTSCCPGWVKFCENFYPEFMPHLSSTKSPQQIFGSLVKTYYSQIAGISPDKIFSVSVMPCIAKKFEAAREEHQDSGHRDVDAVLTTRELARMIRMSGINFADLPDGEFDSPMGYASGAGVIFGASGGVMEAALRTLYDKLVGGDIPEEDLEKVRSFNELREAEIHLGDRTVRVAVARNLGEARKLCDRVRNKKAEYDFIEIMACPGACTGGGGQPIYSNLDKWSLQIDLRKSRARGLFEADSQKKHRKSHENPYVHKLYEDFLGGPNSTKAHELLHTGHKARPLYTNRGDYAGDKVEHRHYREEHNLLH
jgi:iron-only hydrogenase group A